MSDSETQQCKAWFSQAVDDCMSSLYAMAMRLTNNSADAEDLVAEAVTKAWKSLHLLQQRERFRPWIYAIQRNLFISQYRKKRARPDTSSYDRLSEGCSGGEIAALLIEQPDDFLSWWANPEETFVNGLLGEEIVRALEALPEAFRETVILVNLEGLAYDEAAEALGVSPGTIRSRMNRGRTLLQKQLWLHAIDAGLVSQDRLMESSR
ncbi:MAG: sigma-70 family RNA polymerase sigma factor [Candidatus Thiodiazotropha sp. (ex Ctena orbiculata)]|uniref:Sigma-70 family RNA polymerase sigma factor n=1 Tax=Candidatus Thiodiazotropha taylori TaxID=2792791 RepID=A0A944QS85_9GAMM|nr:sigma-70 family RNA polymerase sigma factor [Candidatus Thiodiazotropha taylori]MBT3026071.1 sigma-70 family RNA polymerase sigma factor [Candidatus Thiodiazotropha taylori]MBT3033456.1 sigma-70 family RNA polymerase sigma factor [Candidatus Thiodiazotropha taylori]MBV2135883.1 sigma-70 family RNA polymerase sigma factor [Candidatus Thiodiazotropha taylori]